MGERLNEQPSHPHPPTMATASRLIRPVATPIARGLSTTSSASTPPHLLSLADLSVPQLSTLLQSAHAMKASYRAHQIPKAAQGYGLPLQERELLKGRTVALMFSKRSTRTRVASESATALLGGHAMFLGASDIQLGVNESLFDTAKVVSSMVDGIMARVGHHSEVETLAANSTVPVINALSHLYHPTQILADLLTMLETYSPSSTATNGDPPSLSSLRGLTIAWIGDSNNILNDMIVSFARLGIHLRVATPKGYPLEEVVMQTAREGLSSERIGGTATKEVLHYFNSPEEAVKGADIIVTDTWISMGQEAEKQTRLRDFAGYQVTMDLAKRGQAKPEWKFMHCLPRKAEEVDDEVFYSDRSLVFPEAENRKWTIMALFEAYFGRWQAS